MGNDQSQKSKQHSQSQKYSNYSASVDAGSNPIEESGRSRSVSNPAIPAYPEAVRPKSKHDTLVVVNRGNSPGRCSTEKCISELQSIPQFTALLSQNLGTSATLSPTDWVYLTQRLQGHLKCCSDAVSFDQNSLVIRVKEVDNTVSMLYAALNERQKKLARHEEQVARARELNTTLNKVRVGLGHTASLMTALNEMLPDSHRLEPIELGLKPFSQSHRSQQKSSRTCRVKSQKLNTSSLQADTESLSTVHRREDGRKQPPSKQQS